VARPHKAFGECESVHCQGEHGCTVGALLVSDHISDVPTLCCIPCVTNADAQAQYWGTSESLTCNSQLYHTHCKASSACNHITKLNTRCLLHTATYPNVCSRVSKKESTHSQSQQNTMQGRGPKPEPLTGHPRYEKVKGSSALLWAPWKIPSCMCLRHEGSASSYLYVYCDYAGPRPQQWHVWLRAAGTGQADRRTHCVQVH
jgi:hypothetical protein